MRLRQWVPLCFVAVCLGSIALADNPPADKASGATANTTTTAKASAATSASPSAEAAKKMVCRTEKVTGSSLRTRKVCSTPDSESGSQEWVREQQQRGAIGASSILNGGQ